MPGACVLDLHGLRVPQLTDAEDGLLGQIDDETSRVVARAGDGEAIRQPGRYLRLRLEASYRHRIEGLDTVALRAHLDLRDALDVVTRSAEGEDRLRSRSAARVIRDGDDLWRQLGAWPWAVIKDQLPFDWRRRVDVEEALADWHARTMQAGARQVAQLAHRLRARSAWPVG
jgi:hypothetical protein